LSEKLSYPAERRG